MCTQLIPGKLKSELFHLLVSMSSIRSNKAVLSLHDHFVLGFTRAEVCNKHGIAPSYLSVKIKEFRSLYKISRTLFLFYLENDI
ncbi:PapB/FocB family fimbrial expression transcriptional regulator [Escherichia coli]|uniref:PapB/FocB family fimbrial expression transcriptional regulator n=1 Tax=Escherichia coli TaxID=562 RepID=UPI00143250D0|nr:hypothetical protein [Escherichia coli]NJQ27185.1 hypothetical protein [Escherichia coli]NJQ36575.1 hypothetical protein [Escherichia coli]NJQ50579.1 hypothetical protein [Escherichia coli]HAX9745799.1 hypothetical protein [Escherichia coli]